MPALRPVQGEEGRTICTAFHAGLNWLTQVEHNQFVGVDIQGGEAASPES